MSPQTVKRQSRKADLDAGDSQNDETVSLPELPNHTDARRGSAHVYDKQTEHKIDQLIKIVESIDKRLAVISQALSKQ